MIAKKTKQPQIINARSGQSAIVRARITERLTTDAGYLVVGVYEAQNEEEWNIFDSFQKQFTNEEVSQLYQTFKSQITTTEFPEVYDQLTAISLGYILVDEGNWGLTINDWE